jgi:hypothetical protein
VTEYREVQRVVQRPEYYTEYEDREVTEYRRVCENQAVQIPTVSYQTVTECRTVQKDCGRWVTQTECRPKMAPCDYDNRPDVFGAFNRAAYSLRMALTPDHVSRQCWEPNIVTQQIPVTRQVAVRGTRTVNRTVARIVPVTTRRHQDAHGLPERDPPPAGHGLQDGSRGERLRLREPGGRQLPGREYGRPHRDLLGRSAAHSRRG